MFFAFDVEIVCFGSCGEDEVLVRVFVMLGGDFLIFEVDVCGGGSDEVEVFVFEKGFVFEGDVVSCEVACGEFVEERGECEIVFFADEGDGLVCFEEMLCGVDAAEAAADDEVLVVLHIHTRRSLARVTINVFT